MFMWSLRALLLAGCGSIWRHNPKNLSLEEHRGAQGFIVSRARPHTQKAIFSNPRHLST